MNGLLSAREVGDVLGGVTVETVMTPVKEKGLPCRCFGRLLLDEVRDWVASFPDESSGACPPSEFGWSPSLPLLRAGSPPGSRRSHLR